MEKNKLDRLFFTPEFVPKRHKFISQSRIGDSANPDRSGFAFLAINRFGMEEYDENQGIFKTI